MSPDRASRTVVLDRLERVDAMIAEIRRLPLDDRVAFFGDTRNIWTSESCLRRSLEALLDLGRHLLAAVATRAPAEYKAIADGLLEIGLFDAEDAALLRRMAGYRNRLVHFYNDVEADELFEVVSEHLEDVEAIADALRRWLSTRKRSRRPDGGVAGLARIA